MLCGRIFVVLQPGKYDGCITASKILVALVVYNPVAHHRLSVVGSWTGCCTAVDIVVGLLVSVVAWILTSLVLWCRGM